MSQGSIDNFVNIPFKPSNLDRFVVRTLILKSLECELPKFFGRFLDAGCGKMPYKQVILSGGRVTEYIGLDIETARLYDTVVKPDVLWDGVKMPFSNEMFETCMATEVLEHCPDPDVFLHEACRVLKGDGIFFFTVPFIWNLHEVPFDEYRYTPFSLERHLKKAGFSEINIRATGGWHASFALFIGLWVRRSKLGRVVRFVLSVVFMPIIWMLLRSDKKPNQFKEGTMIPGLYGTARKPKS